MIKKFFQHVDVSNTDIFLQVTQLSYIDDTDPYMVLYHFKDDTKCNEEFIGTFDKTVDTENINEFVLVQIEDNYKWNCNVIKHQAKVQTAVTATGEQVIVPDATMLTHDGKALDNVTRYEWTAPRQPKKIVNNNLAIFKVSNIKYFLKTGELPDEIVTATAKEKYEILSEMSLILDFIPSYIIPDELSKKMSIYLQNASHVYGNEISNDIPAVAEVKKEVEYVKEPVNIGMPDKREPFRCKDKRDSTPMTVREEIDGVYIDLAEDTFNIKDLIEEYKVLKEKAEELAQEPDIHEQLKSVDKNTLNFLSNMIANAAKKTAEASVSIELDVPPFDVYKLLKTAYPENWANTFIDIIATSVAPSALQYALGEGLKAYYESEMQK